MKPATNLAGFEWLALVNRSSLKADAFAGLTGAAVVLPQAVAFAAIAGLPPEYGLYTAMITPIIAALFGSSLVMVSGPTTAISAVVFSSLAGNMQPGSPEFIQSAILLALMVGVLQIIFALVRVGRLAGFVSHSVMTGFTASAALLIAVSQFGPSLGLPPSSGHGFLGRLQSLIADVPQFSLPALICAGLTLATVVLLRIFLPRWPGFLIAIAVGTVSVQMMGGWAADLRFVGALPAAYPAFQLPGFNSGHMAGLLESAFAIALIGLLEAIAIGRSLSHRTRTEFSANREVMGQGLSNAVGGLFQCYPASGSFTRSSVNLEAGASSPFAAIFAALFLVIMVMIFRPLVEIVPISSVAGLILYVAWRLLDFREFNHLIRTSRRETSIAALTFLTGLFVNLEFAIYVGTFASLAVFLSKSANPDLAVGAPDPDAEHRKIKNAELFGLEECPSVLITRLDGPLFFGSVDSINAQFRKLTRNRPDQINLVLILHGVGDVDLAGVELLEREIERRRAVGGDIFVVAHYPPLAKRLKELGLLDVIGHDHLFDNKGAAITAAVGNVTHDICSRCTARVFTECDARPSAKEKSA
ncbi:SulP family inorganic anion transporter [Ruegeria atlantica]|uniref:SulP family inorganic anion transporter n=1 Tax=Ruegeria atlantica TaxID=81569 RepID=UPI0014815E1F|nr:SulP family inorganic anion transporter [Ruegeria atlantica]